MEMFCYQCEQTAKGTGCTRAGVCGKSADVAAFQDLLVHAAKGIAQYAHRARGVGVDDAVTNRFTLEALFTTVTNVNFDADRIEDMIRRAGKIKQRIADLYHDAILKAGNIEEDLSGPARWVPAESREGLLKEAAEVGIQARIDAFGEDISGLQELLVYGLKGTAAYADHAMILGREDSEVYAFFHEALDYLAGEEQTVDDLLGLNLRCGEINLKVMEMLDSANTGAYGNPVPTSVRIEPVKGKAILVSGHDLKDLHELLKQTEETGINVYTHGEMLPAHGYPGLKRFRHLAGNYGGAWQDQNKEFEAFPGPILMTTNCIQRPRDSYKDRIFTCGLVAWPGVTHIADRDFTPVIAAARAAEGFETDGPDKFITVGFGHDAVMGVADKVIEAVKAGAIRHFFLVGGCDGAKSGRNYYTEFVEKVPRDCVVLTLACGKYRFNKLDLGDIPLRDKATGDTVGGIPRLLDIGQCNDAYSAVRIASALAEAFDTDVNALPLSLVLSWYEQKAVCILLTLLALGIKGIRLGPSLPAFVTPTVLNVLVEKFDIKPIGTPEDDLADCLGM